MDRLRYTPPFADSFRARAIALGLIVAGVATACGVGSPRTDSQTTLQQIDGDAQLQDGEIFVREAVITTDTPDEAQQVRNNDGVNVRAWPGSNLSQDWSPVLGRVSPNTAVSDGIYSNNNGFLAVKCEQVLTLAVIQEAMEIGFIKPEAPVCYLNGDFVNSQDIPDHPIPQVISS